MGSCLMVLGELMPRQRILVTGAAGKLGSAIAARLACDYEVVQLDRVPPSNPVQRDAGAFHVGSITDRFAVSCAMEGVNAVVHCGAIPGNRSPFDELLQINVGGTINLLEEAGSRAECAQFIFISSIRVHGVLEAVRPEFMPHFLPFDETHPHLTVEYYGGGKLQAEHWCRMYVKRFGKPVVVFRPSYILPAALESSFRAREASDTPSLEQYVATSDFAEAIAAALTYEPTDGIEAFLIHAPDQFTLTPSIELAKRHFPGVPVDKEKLSGCGGYGAFVDCTRACERLGWRPRYALKRV